MSRFRAVLTREINLQRPPARLCREPAAYPPCSRRRSAAHLPMEMDGFFAFRGFSRPPETGADRCPNTSRMGAAHVPGTDGAGRNTSRIGAAHVPVRPHGAKEAANRAEMRLLEAESMPKRSLLNVFGCLFDAFRARLRCVFAFKGGRLPPIKPIGRAEGGKKTPGRFGFSASDVWRRSELCVCGFSFWNKPPGTAHFAWLNAVRKRRFFDCPSSECGESSAPQTAHSAGSARFANAVYFRLRVWEYAECPASQTAYFVWFGPVRKRRFFGGWRRNTPEVFDLLRTPPPGCGSENPSADARSAL